MAAPKIARDIRDYLVGAPLSLTLVGINQMSDTDNYAVIEYPGPTNVKAHGPTIAIDVARLQIQARHVTAQTALTNIHAILDELDGKKDTTINSVVYLYMTLVSRPRIIERDEKGRSTYAFEIEVHARR